MIIKDNKDFVLPHCKSLFVLSKKFVESLFVKEEAISKISVAFMDPKLIYDQIRRLSQH